MKTMAAGAAVLLAGMMWLKADSNPDAPATSGGDNPLAGLNLGDPNAPKPLSFTDKVIKHLVVLDENGQLKTFDSSTLQNVKYWAFYYSASWCVYCRAFTPKLVSFYKTFKAQHPDFEVIFVNDDQSEEDMTAYMKKDGMAWPAVQFDYIANSGANKLSGPGIPDLVLVDGNGKVLADSYDGANYVGPDSVMQKIPEIVR